MKVRGAPAVRRKPSKKRSSQLTPSPLTIHTAREERRLDGAAPPGQRARGGGVPGVGGLAGAAAGDGPAEGNHDGADRGEPLRGNNQKKGHDRPAPAFFLRLITPLTPLTQPTRRPTSPPAKSGRPTGTTTASPCSAPRGSPSPPRPCPGGGPPVSSPTPRRTPRPSRRRTRRHWTRRCAPSRRAPSSFPPPMRGRGGCRPRRPRRPRRRRRVRRRVRRGGGAARGCSCARRCP